MSAKGERWWRVAHLILAWLAVLGLLAHVVTTLFFAGLIGARRSERLQWDWKTLASIIDMT